MKQKEKTNSSIRRKSVVRKINQIKQTNNNNICIKTNRISKNKNKNQTQTNNLANKNQTRNLVKKKQSGKNKQRNSKQTTNGSKTKCKSNKQINCHLHKWTCQNKKEFLFGLVPKS